MKKRVKIYHKKRYKNQKLTTLFLIILVIFIFIALILSKSGIKVPFFPNLGMENVALGRVAHSSSWLSLTNSATQAVDGNQSTSWQSNHILPASLTVYLDHPYIIDQIVIKLPNSWGARTETIEVLGSLDNTSFTRIVAPTSYSISPITTININPVIYKYIRLVVSKNSQTDVAQIGEFEVYGTNPHIPWAIQSIDVMKYSKDVVCNQPSMTTINSMVDKIASSGANFVAIATPYDNPSCNSAIDLTNNWIASARSRNLHVWHRHIGLAFEGIYGITKIKDLTSYTQQIVDYINNNSTQFQDGDIFTPTPEPDSAGISGVTYCSTICQFSSADEYNSWIQTTQSSVKSAFAKLNKNIKVGYYGHSSFIVWGENNPDWTGKGFLTQATVDSMDGIIAMDTYPEFYGGHVTDSLIGAHTRWPNANIIVGEWGTVTSITDNQRTMGIIDAMSGAEKSYVIGFNYWNLGPSGNEGLLDANFNPLPAFQTLKDFYTGLR